MPINKASGLYCYYLGEIWCINIDGKKMATMKNKLYISNNSIAENDLNNMDVRF